MSDPKSEPRPLTADDILALPDLRQAPRVEPVDLPELNGRVWVRELSSAERDRLDGSLVADEGQVPENVRAKWVAACACDAAGKPLFLPTQVAALGARSAAVVERLFRAARALNPRVEDEVAAAKKGSAGG
jgi:hypothetical protein